jgi:methyltransferase-like protein
MPGFEKGPCLLGATYVACQLAMDYISNSDFVVLLYCHIEYFDTVRRDADSMLDENISSYGLVG